MICFAVFLAFVCYFYDILRKGAPLEFPDKRGTAVMQGAKRKSTHGWMLLLGVGDGIAWQGTKRLSRSAQSFRFLTHCLVRFVLFHVVHGAASIELIVLQHLSPFHLADHIDPA